MAAPRILITRSPHQASALAEMLRAVGAEPVLIPAIELAEPTSFAPLDAALAGLDGFDWLIFTSANAVEAFHRRRTGGSAELGTPAPNSRTRVLLPHNLRIAAIGSATARALDAVGLRADLLPAQAVAESLADELLPHVRQRDGSLARFLLVRAEIAREILPDTLRAAGAEVVIVPAYRTVVPSDSIAAVRQIFSSREFWPSAITFTSSSTATNLLALLEVAGLRLPQEILRISIGPITSQTLRDLGYPPHAEAAEANISSLVETVVDSLGLRHDAR